MGVSRQSQLHRGLPDVRIVEPPGRHHELDRLGQIRHLLLGEHCPIGPHAEVGVTADKAHLSVVLTIFKPHCREEQERERRKRITESHREIYSIRCL